MTELKDLIEIVHEEWCDLKRGCLCKPRKTIDMEDLIKWAESKAVKVMLYDEHNKQPYIVIKAVPLEEFKTDKEEQWQTKCFI